MKAEKIIQTTEPVNLDIEGITLLSRSEYKEYRDRIPARKFWWWLRSPDKYYGIYAGVVDDDGSIDAYIVYYERGVSPALICNLTSSNLEIGDKINWRGFTWTVISDKYVLCDDKIGDHCFRKDWQAEDANVYEKSDVKKYVEGWLKEAMEDDMTG